MGMFEVAALVDDVNVSGDGKMQMILSSPLLPALNRQLQFINYTNTIFHPNTADIGELPCSTDATFTHALDLSLCGHQ